MNNNSIKFVASFFIFMLTIFELQAANEKPIVTQMVNQQIVAINAYDSVAYFTQDKAVKGTSEFSVQYLGVNWYFSNEVNKQLFENNPEKYAPQFNGHCANGLSDGHQVPGNPKYFRIIDDKLYFFYSKWGRLQWQINQPEQIKLANEYWESNN